VPLWRDFWLLLTSDWLVTSAKADFIIGFHLDKGTTIFKMLVQRGQPCAMLLLLSVTSRSSQDPTTGINNGKMFT
jgi:hypothetical protein